MPNNLQLLKQIRNVTTVLSRAIDNPEHKDLLSVVDLFLNELMLQETPAFYLDFLKRGKALLAEGRSLAAKLGGKPVVAGTLRDDLNEESRIEAINAEIETVFAGLASIVKALDENRSAQEKDFLLRVSQWESSLSSHHLEQVAGKPPEESAKPITPESFRIYLEKKFPHWRGLKVTAFNSLPGGNSKKTILVETEDAVNGRQSLVIRAETPVTLLPIDGSDVRREFYMIQLMCKLGIPGAEALWLEEDRSLLGTRFIVSRKAEGKTIGSSMGGSERPSAELLQSFMSTFFRMHNLKLDPADPLVQKSHLKEWLPQRTIRDTARYFAARYLPEMTRRAGITISPQVMYALRWLEKNVPDVDEPPVILHVDYAYNNILVADNKVTAVLDWETSILGDPAYDIIWTQQNLGTYSMPEFLDKYKAATGREVSEYRLAYASVAKCVWAVIAGWNALRALDTDDNAPLHLGVIAFKYVPILGANVDKLIAAAENARGK